MSQDGTNPTTKSILSKVLRRGKSSTPSTELPDLDAVQLEPTDVAQPVSEETLVVAEQKAMGLAELEAQIALAKQAGYKWLEIPRETLELVAGEYPPLHYIVYKDVKICPFGFAEECKKKEKVLDIELVFPNDKFKKISG